MNRCRLCLGQRQEGASQSEETCSGRHLEEDVGGRSNASLLQSVANRAVLILHVLPHSAG